MRFTREATETIPVLQYIGKRAGQFHDDVIWRKEPITAAGQNKYCNFVREEQNSPPGCCKYLVFLTELFKVFLKVFFLM